MLSIGIRFGQGFDEMSSLKVLQSIPVPYDYDLLVIGTNPGGIACAREASSAGKKTAIIRWKEYTAAERDGFDEDMTEMRTALEIQPSVVSVRDAGEGATSVEFVFSKLDKKRSSVKESRRSGTFTGASPRGSKQSSMKYSRKVRRSRLDLNNELFRRGKECVKVMQNAATLGDVVENAFNSGWRLCTTRPPLSINWHKMTEEIMDYVMKKNHELMSDLSSEGVEILEGRAAFVDTHTVLVTGREKETTVTADLICIALNGKYKLPKDVEGSSEFGITFDDFSRLSEPPKKTLVVGGTSEGLECAGVLACCRFPVTLVTRKNILQDCDSEITQMILLNLKKKGVKVLEEVSLKSITVTNDNRLLATFEFRKPESEGQKDEEREKETVTETDSFDTVLFAVGKNVDLKTLKINSAEVECDPGSGKIRTDNLATTSAPNIYAIGDAVFGVPECTEASELAGKLLGRRLFHNEEHEMDYSFNPVVIYTPIEYGFVGITEDKAFYRFGLYCVEVHHGFFEPLDFVLPQTEQKCFAKIIVFKSTNVVIGMHVLGPRAGDIIQGFAAAMKTGLTMRTLRTIVGVPASNAKEFLKLRGLKTFEEKVPTASEVSLT